MLIQRVSRTTAEKVFLICQNSEASSITTGMAARFMGGAAAEIVSTDGVQVCKLDAATAFWNFAGIADQDIVSLGYGRIQAWGYVNSIMLSNQNTSVTCGVTGIDGSFLKLGAVAGTLTSSQTAQALSTFGYKFVQNLVTTMTSTAAYVWTSGFVRAL